MKNKTLQELLTILLNTSTENHLLHPAWEVLQTKEGWQKFLPELWPMWGPAADVMILNESYREDWPYVLSAYPGLAAAVCDQISGWIGEGQLSLWEVLLNYNPFYLMQDGTYHFAFVLIERWYSKKEDKDFLDVTIRATLGPWILKGKDPFGNEMPPTPECISHLFD